MNSIETGDAVHFTFHKHFRHGDNPAHTTLEDNPGIGVTPKQDYFSSHKYYIDFYIELLDK